MKKIKLNNYAITLTAVVLLVLVFGISLTQGASFEQDKNNQSISQLNSKVTALENDLQSLKKDDQNDHKKIQSLSNSLKLLGKSFQQNQTKQKVTSLGSLFSVVSVKQPKTSQNAKSKKTVKEKIVNYSYLEIAGLSSFKVDILEANNALDQLIFASKQYNFSIKTTQYDFGTFVDCIGGICSDSNHFWSLYKNGEASQVGAGSLNININDKISWVYVAF